MGSIIGLDSSKQGCGPECSEAHTYRPGCEKHGSPPRLDDDEVAAFELWLEEYILDGGSLRYDHIALAAWTAALMRFFSIQARAKARSKR